MSNVVGAEILEPYASALMSLAQSQNLVDRFSEDVSGLLNLLNESDELRQLIANPLVQQDLKKSILQQAVGEQVHPQVRNFLMVLVDRRRIMFLEGICKQFQALLRELNQTVLAEVISVLPLNDAQRHTISEKVMGMTGARQVELETKLDPSLIGGVIIKVGSQVVDASLRGQLRQVSLRLTKAS
jgi:F-type H+-transporting ATPase subunit delta